MHMANKCVCVCTTTPPPPPRGRLSLAQVFLFSDGALAYWRGRLRVLALLGGSVGAFGVLPEAAGSRPCSLTGKPARSLVLWLLYTFSPGGWDLCCMPYMRAACWEEALFAFLVSAVGVAHRVCLHAGSWFLWRRCSASGSGGARGACSAGWTLRRRLRWSLSLALGVTLAVDVAGGARRSGEVFGLGCDFCGLSAPGGCSLVDPRTRPSADWASGPTRGGMLPASGTFLIVLPLSTRTPPLALPSSSPPSLFSLLSLGFGHIPRVQAGAAQVSALGFDVAGGSAGSIASGASRDGSSSRSASSGASLVALRDRKSVV